MEPNEICGIDFDQYKTKEQRHTEAKKRPTNCEVCVYYDYDADADAMVCGMDLDEDEQVHFLEGNAARCPYFRFYDEYKSVRKQN